MSIYSDSSFIISAAGGYKEGGGSAGKLYNLKPDGATYPAMDVTGGGNAVSQNSDGAWQINWPANTPRFKWNDGVPSILVESQRQNLITYPRSFDNAYWNKTGATVDDNAGAGYACPFIDSDGVNTLEGFKLVEDGSTGNHYIYAVISGLTLNERYSLSLFVKKSERTNLQISNNSISQGINNFNLTDGTIISTGGNGNVSITPVSDSWYLIKIENYLNNTATFNSIVFYLLDDLGNRSYTGGGTSGIYICHAQLEQAASASSPIYGAEGSVLTRLADTIQVALPAGVTKVELTNSSDVVTTDESPSDPYQIPVGSWKSIIMS